MKSESEERPDDEALMLRVRETADPEAFNELMLRWEVPVKRYLGRMLQNAAEAEDLAQDAFARVFEHRARYRDGARFTAWLYAIAANLARNRLRWWRRRPQVALDAWDEDESPGRTGPALQLPDATQGSHVVERRERARPVREAVTALPVRLREVVVLCEYENLSQAEAAEALGTSAKGVETRLYRARAALRERLALLLH